MVDNRSAGIIGAIAGGINFRSDDISGTAAKTADDRSTPGMEYFAPETAEQNSGSNAYIDRSMELRASLNSLALLNVVSVLRNNRKKSIILEDEDLTEKITTKKVQKIPYDTDSSEKEKENM